MAAGYLNLGSQARGGQKGLLLVFTIPSPQAKGFPYSSQEHFLAGFVALYRMSCELQDVSADKEGYCQVYMAQDQEDRGDDKAGWDAGHVKPKADGILVPLTPVAYGVDHKFRTLEQFKIDLPHVFGLRLQLAASHNLNI